jgi:cell division protease FtsH
MHACTLSVALMLWCSYQVDDTAPPDGYDFHATDMSTEQARIGMAEIISMLESGEAKAYHGLAINWRPLLALADALESKGSLKGREVVAVLEAAGCVHYTDPYIKGYGWDAADGGRLSYPLKEKTLVGAGARGSGGADDVAQQPEPTPVLTGVRAKTWYAGTALDAPRNPDGTFKYGWHWGMPYTLKRNIDPTSFPSS